MVDVSKHSAFPPLLGRYNPEIDSKVKHTPGCYQATAGIRSLVEGRQAATISTDHRTKRRARTRTKRKSLTVSVENISKKIEGEARRKRHEKAEAIVKSWDTLLREEKSQKHHLLQERVKMQRELIGKNDEFSNDLKSKAEEDRLERLQRRKETQKEIVAGLRAHLQRVEEHKTRISTKMQEISSTDEGLEPVFSTMGAIQREPSLHQDFTIIKAGDRQLESETSPRSVDRSQEVTLKVPGVDSDDSNTIDSMWRDWKTDAIRKLTPMVMYSDQLKQVACPSVRQCLDFYEKPTARDRYTGKPIPLSDVLGEMSITRGQQYSTRNSALEVVTRQTQKRAEIMLQRKEPFKIAESYNPDNYLEEPLDLEEPTSVPTSKLATAGKPVSMIQPKRIKTGTTQRVKKILPSYLTPNGDVCSGSLEEFGDKFFCAPSRKKNGERIKETYGHSEGSVFLTDLQMDGVTSPPDSASFSQSDLTKGSKTNIRAKRTTLKRKTSWQPLCSSALFEHRKVTEVPVPGLGHLAHGRYSMWKPSTCIVDSEDCFET